MRWIPVAALLAVVAPAAYAQGTDEERAACADDYRKFCARIPPDDSAGILACFKEHRKELTDACRKIIDTRRK